MRGTVSKASFMSTAAKSVLYSGLGTFGPSCMYCVSVVRSVVAEYRALKPCCVGGKRTCGVNLLRISLSRISIGVYNKEIGQYDEGSVGILLGFSKGVMLLLLWTIILWLKMSVRTPKATSPKCFKCR